MEKKNKKLPIIIGAIVAVVAAIVVILLLNGGHRIIKVEYFTGEVTLERAAEEKEIIEGMNLKSGDSVATGNDGQMALLVDTDKHILAQENTGFSIVCTGKEEKGKLRINLEYGTALVEIENKLSDGSSVELNTPNAALSVRGTIFETTYLPADNTTIVKVTEGLVNVVTTTKEMDIPAGQMAIIKDDEIMLEPLTTNSGSTVAVGDEVLESELMNQVINGDEWPQLLKGGATEEQLAYMLRIAKIAHQEGHDDYLKIALNYMTFESYSYIEPLYQTAENNNVYDVNTLNTMFTFLTDETISEEHLTPPSTIYGNEVTCIYTGGLQSGIHIISSSIIEAHYGENNEIIVEFQCVTQNIDMGELAYINSIAHLVQDEDGKYVFGYIE